MSRPRNAIILTTALAALLATVGPAMTAPPEGKGKPEHAGGPSKGQGGSADVAKDKGRDSGPAVRGGGRQDNDVDVGDIILDTVLTEIERRLIRDYFGGVSRADLPPGLAKRDRLPPGLARQIQRNGTLPPGLSGHRLPDDLLHRLPRRGDGYDRVIVGSDVILIERGTRLILDIMENVLSS